MYLSNQQEVFAYISAPSVLLLLESLDPIMVLLDRKQDFLANLLHAIGALRTYIDRLFYELIILLHMIR